MGKAFIHFCHALFDRKLWEEETSRILGREGQPPPDESRWASFCENDIPRPALLELIYRHQFARLPTNFFTTIDKMIEGSRALDQYVYEFIQNAEDAEATCCRFLLEQDLIVVANNGHEFSAENLYAICSFSESDKPQQTGERVRIGKFGQGFKSVFRICEKPLIVTWNPKRFVAFEFFRKGGRNEEYHNMLEGKVSLTFPERMPESNQEGRREHLESLGFVFPVVKEFQSRDRLQRAMPGAATDEGAVFVLPLRKELKCDPDKVLHDLNPRCFLFLNNLQRLELKKGNGAGRVWVKKTLPSEPAREWKHIVLQEIRESDNAILSKEEALQYDGRTAVVDTSILTGFDDEQRRAITGSHPLMLVVPLGESGEIAEPDSNPGGLIFNTLPVGDDGTGPRTKLTFHINAPFNLDPRRQDVSSDDFNRWLLDQAAQLAVHFLNLLRNCQKFEGQAYRLVPSRLQGHDPGLARDKRDLLWSVREHLRKEASQRGIFPVLGGGNPLPAAKVVALTGANAGHEVAAALQSLLGSVSAQVFRELTKTWKNGSLRFTPVPSGAKHLQALVEEEKVDQFKLEWVRHWLAQTDLVLGKDATDPRWHEYLLVYAAHGAAGADLGHLAELPWLAPLSPGNTPLLPRKTFELRAATADELPRIDRGLRALPPSPDGSRLYPAPMRYLDAFRRVIGEGPEAAAVEKRLRALRPQTIEWKDLGRIVFVALESSKTPEDGTAAQRTPDAVLDLLDLLAQRGALGAENVGGLAAHVYVPVNQQTGLQGSVQATAWPCADLWPVASEGWPVVPDELVPFLPRVTDEIGRKRTDLIQRLVPSAPSPRLVGLLCSCLERPSAQTFRWALQVYQRAKDGTRGYEQIVGALRQLRVPEENATETEPYPRLGDLYAAGFGQQGEELTEALSQLFGSRAPDLGRCGLTEGETTLLMGLLNQGPFVPSPSQVVDAVGQLVAVLEPEEQRRLAMAFWVFLGTYPDALLSPGPPHSTRRLLPELQNPSWLPLVNRTRDTPTCLQVWIGGPELNPLLSNMVPLLARPTGGLADRWQQACTTFERLKIIRFIRPADLTPTQREHVREKLLGATPDMWPDQDWQRCLLKAIAWAHDNRLLYQTDRDQLRKQFLGQGLPPDWSIRPETVPVIVSGPEEQKNCQRFLGTRAITVLLEAEPDVRRGLCWLLDGFSRYPDTESALLGNAEFARRYILALSSSATESSEPLREPDRTNVVDAYEALCDQPSPWFAADVQAVLTASDRLAVPAEVYFITHPIASIVRRNHPECCLTESITDTKVIRGLDVVRVPEDARDLLVSNPQPTEPWSTLEIRREHQKDLPCALRERFQVQGAVELRRVDQVVQTWQFTPTGDIYPEELGHLLCMGPPAVLYLGPADSNALLARLEKLYLANLGAEALRDEQKRLEQRRAFREQLADAEREVNTLASSQKTDLLGYYRMSIERGFVRVDNDPIRTVEQRCALIFGDPARLNRLVTRLTVDLGYGVNTIVRELLQNIDDAYRDSPREVETPWAMFECDDQLLIVRHEGRRFNEKRHGARAGEAGPEDLRGICSLGGTEKDRGLQIGRFGLGFKSVYAITSEPEIQSHPYYFRIAHVVIPRWRAPTDGEIQDLIEMRNVTGFFFSSPPQKRDKLQLLKAELARGEQLRPHDLLFLHRLSEVTVAVDGTSRTIRRIACPVPAGFSPPSNSPTPEQVCCWRLEEDRGATNTQRLTAFLVFSGTQQARVPTAEGDLQENLQAAVAFPWDADQGCYVPMESAGGRLFLFLSTGDITGLPFHLHGQFLTNLGRTDVSGDVECNLHIAERLAELVRSALLRSFDTWKTEPERLKTIYHVVPSTLDLVAGRCHWLAGVYQVFARLLEEGERVVLTSAQELARPSECWIGSQVVHELHEELAGTVGCSAAMKQLAFVKLEETSERALLLLRGHLCEVRGPDLVAHLFPMGLSRTEAILRCRAVLLFLYVCKKLGEEERATLSRLSDLRCFPDTANGLGCPSELCPKDRVPKWCMEGTWADIDAVALDDKQLKRWILNNKYLRWADPPEEPKPNVPYDAEIQECYLPFSPRRLLEGAEDQPWGHFLKVDGGDGLSPEKHLQYYLRSAERYKRFIEQHRDGSEDELGLEELQLDQLAILDEEAWRGKALSKLKGPCQIEKDERFWVIACLLHYYYLTPEERVLRLTELMERCFPGEHPPWHAVDSECDTWAKCFGGELRLYFEVNLPSPPGYRAIWLPHHVDQQHIIPHVRNAARGRDRAVRKDLEGPTHVDALLLNTTNGFSILFEAKVLSDISYQISFDTMRDQIARNIDVMLEKNDGYTDPLPRRYPERTLFILLTPEIFRSNPLSRLYGHLMQEYRRPGSTALADALIHRGDAVQIADRRTLQWEEVQSRLGWLTWEDCNHVWPWAKGRLRDSLMIEKQDALRLRCKRPEPSLSITVPERVVVEAGSSERFLVQINRDDGLEGGVDVQFHNVPKDVTLPGRTNRLSEECIEVQAGMQAAEKDTPVAVSATCGQVSAYTALILSVTRRTPPAQLSPSGS